jgi:hypothetical protein
MVGCAAALSVMAVITPAAAQEVIVVMPGPPPPPPPPMVVYMQPPPPPMARVEYVENWYGWQTLIADGATLALWIGGSAANSSAITDIGTATYLAGPPVLHFVHRKVGIGFASFGIRLAAPVVLGLTGFAIGCAAGGSNGNGNSADFGLAAGCLAGALVGVLTGYATAVTLDAAVFAYQRIRVVPGQPGQQGSAEDRKDSSFSIRPNISLLPGRGTAGIAGTF